MDFKGKSTEELQALVQATERLGVVKAAQTSLLPFIKYTMPDPEAHDDVNKSVYVETPQARLLCEVLEKIERTVAGKSTSKNALKRVAVSIGPQLGKSEIISRRFPAWFSGRNPRKHVMLGTYNQDFANDFGDEVREIARSKPFKDVFPKFGFRKGSEAKNMLVTSEGGKLAFVGVGGSGSGKPADLFVIDDPIKSDAEAQSDVHRDMLRRWFYKVSFARLHGRSAIVIVHTRWHEDDLIGCLVDPDHPEHDPVIAKKWTYINLPAVVTDPKLAKALGLYLTKPEHPEVIEQFGDQPMAALWEDRKPLVFLAEARRMDPRGFDALYMGRPSPEDGTYFTRDMLVEYGPDELPERLHKYGASDHALSEKQEADESVVGCIGVDEDDTLWVLPDLWMGKCETDELVEELLVKMRMHNPLMWWAENEHISKAFGPFLKKRMLETNTYTTLDPITPSKDIRLRARAFQGRASMGKVRFPRYAPWWAKAKDQLLKFPYATHDDFVAWCALIGLGLMKEVSADRERPPEKVVRVGSYQWIKAQSKREARQRELQKASGGW